jgi:hypothetical protein
MTEQEDKTAKSMWNALRLLIVILGSVIFVAFSCGSVWGLSAGWLLSQAFK